MKTNMRLPLGGVALAFTAAASAGTIAFYPFDDGAAGSVVTGVANAAGGWSGATSATAIREGNAPVFDAEGPGRYIYSGAVPTNRLMTAPQSVKFSSDDEASPNKGGKIVFSSLGSNLLAQEKATLELFFKNESAVTWRAVFWMPISGDQSHRWKLSAPASPATKVSMQNQNDTGTGAGGGVAATPADGLKNVWHHFALVYEKEGVGTGLDRLTAYLDHVAIGTYASTHEADFGSGAFTLGCSDSDVEAFFGKVSCLRFSDDALAPEDMLWCRNIDYGSTAAFAFWPCTDGVPGTDVGTISNAVPGVSLIGTAYHAGVADAPAFSDEAPGLFVWSDATQTRVAAHKPRSLAFHTDSATSGNAAYVTFGNLATHFSTCSDFTFEFFAKVETDTTWHTVYYFMLGADASTIWKTCAPAGSANRVEFERQYPAGKCYRDVTDLDNGAWHHLASVYRSSEHLMRFYLDGAEVGSGLACTNAYRAGQHFFLGCSSGTSEGFCGKVSCLRATPCALAPAQFMTCSNASGCRIIVR